MANNKGVTPKKYNMKPIGEEKPKGKDWSALLASCLGVFLAGILKHYLCLGQPEMSASTSFMIFVALYAPIYLALAFLFGKLREKRAQKKQ